MKLKPCKGYESRYLISSCGKLFSKKTAKEIKLHDNSRGYLTYTTRSKDAIIRIKLHIAVAETFIPNPQGKPIVNHKDGNKQNNNRKNLEWSTCSENTLHAWKSGLISRKERK